MYVRKLCNNEFLKKRECDDNGDNNNSDDDDEDKNFKVKLKYIWYWCERVVEEKKENERRK